jgi:TorA maturation chaperone TorD
MPFDLLAQLWLREPDAALAVRGMALLGLSPSTPAELAPAYAEVLLLNIPPYGTVFTDTGAALNAPAAQAMAALFARHGYSPPEVLSVGAPDHLGLGLGFLGHAAARGDEAGFARACAQLLPWAPAVCLAVEREPGAHAFYRALARYTRETLLQNAGHLEGAAPNWPAPEVPQVGSETAGAGGEAPEVRLHDLLRYFLTPARSGVYLSRGWLGSAAHGLGLGLPFGARFDVAQQLFAAAGQSGRFPELLRVLREEVAAWAGDFSRWTAAYPAWSPIAEYWLAATSATLHLIDAMGRVMVEGN